jgi:hypothetical protein
MAEANVRLFDPKLPSCTYTPHCRPNQLFMPHINILDFIIWPAFREFGVQVPELQERMGWMMDMSNNLRCDWYFGNDEAFAKNEETGLLDLCDLAKVCSPPISCESSRKFIDLQFADDTRPP